MNAITLDAIVEIVQNTKALSAAGLPQELLFQQAAQQVAEILRDSGVNETDILATLKLLEQVFQNPEDPGLFDEFQVLLNEKVLDNAVTETTGLSASQKTPTSDDPGGDGDVGSQGAPPETSSPPLGSSTPPLDSSRSPLDNSDPTPFKPPIDLGTPELTGLTSNLLTGRPAPLTPAEVSFLTQDGSDPSLGGAAQQGPESTPLTTERFVYNSGAENQEEAPPATNLSSDYSIVAPTASYDEGTSGVVTLIFEVARTNPVTDAQLTWRLAEALDAAVSSGTVDFVIGQSQALIEVLVRADKLIELDADYMVVLESSDPNVSLVGPQASIRLIDDDGLVSVTVDTSNINEGSSDTSQLLTYTVTRTNTVSETTVDWALTGLDADDLVSGQAQNGSLAFAAGVVSQTFTIEVLGDKTIEADELLSVSLSNAGDNLTLGAVSQVETTVVNDDGTVSIAASQTSIEEGSTGTSQLLTYTVTRTNTVNASSVDWALTGLDADDLVSGQAQNGSLTFAAGVASQTFTIEVLGDKTIEADELLSVSLSNAGDNLTLGTVSQVDTTVVNDDGTVSIAVS
uniref:Calx-beta domain-containing protein n=1 Tax=Amphritea sp. TaxID=1872502 RepID=UPI003A948705